MALVWESRCEGVCLGVAGVEAINAGLQPTSDGLQPTISYSCLNNTYNVRSPSTVTAVEHRYIVIMLPCAAFIGYSLWFTFWHSTEASTDWEFHRDPHKLKQPKSKRVQSPTIQDLVVGHSASHVVHPHPTCCVEGRRSNGAIPRSARHRNGPRRIRSFESFHIPGDLKAWAGPEGLT